MVHQIKKILFIIKYEIYLFDYFDVYDNTSINIIIFIILTIIKNNNNKTIEPFTVIDINYPIINYANIRTIPLSKCSSFMVYMWLKPNNSKNHQNDYIIYAFSSFNVTGNSKLLSVLNNSNINNPPIILTPSTPPPPPPTTTTPTTTDKGLDYIYYDLPEDINENMYYQVLK